MNLVRNLAVRIANFVVHRATPESREWSEARAREIQVVESDWRALAWALSGLRVLFTRPGEPPPTPEELGVAARRYVLSRRAQANRSRLDRSLMWLGMALPGSFLIFRTHGVKRLGWVFFVLFPMTTAIMLGRSQPAREIPEQQDLQGEIVIYRQGLADVSRISSWRFWFIPVNFSILLGWSLAMRISLGLKYFLAGLCLVIVAMFLQQQQRNRRRLAQIDTLLGTANPDEY